MKPADCIGCPYEVKGQGYVPGEGPPNAKLAFIIDGPGRDGAATGKPAVGAAGRRLDIWLTQAGIPRRLCWIDSATRCRIMVRGKDVSPDKAVAECYQRHWGQPLLELEHSLECVVSVGAAASRLLLGSWAGERAAGSLAEVELP